MPILVVNGAVFDVGRNQSARYQNVTAATILARCQPPGTYSFVSQRLEIRQATVKAGLKTLPTS